MAVCAYSAGVDMTQEALKLALDALEANDKFINGTGTNGGLVYCMDSYYSDCFDVDPINKQTEEAITAIKEALAQPEQLHASEDVSIGVDVTEDGAHVTALQSYRNGAKVVFYSQFHSAPQRTEQEPVADDFFRMIADRNPKPFPSPQRT
jgi:hypothetical protein